MDSEDEDYEFDVDPVVTSEQDHTIRYGDHRATTSSTSHSSSSDQEDTDDWVSTHDLPLAEFFSAVKREKYNKSMMCNRCSM